jgi:hypothetical protein
MNVHHRSRLAHVLLRGAKSAARCGISELNTNELDPVKRLVVLGPILPIERNPVELKASVSYLIHFS